MTNHVTALTEKEAYGKLEDAASDYEVTPGERLLLRDYCEAVGRAQMIMQQYLPNLLNPNSVAKTDEWQQVQSLANKLAYEHVDVRLRTKIADLESQLKELGVI